MKLNVTVTGKRLALLPVIAVVGALAVSLSGLVSIAANTGHFGVVKWFLGWTMQNAVRTQSLGISVPEGVELSDPNLVQRAAGQFATGCASCHGAPGVLQSPVVLSMTPAPPRLEQQIPGWRDRELFWIVQHGIKYSGMPAWTTQDRPDEVWAMVAFLRALPEMTAEEYRKLALGETEGEGEGGTAHTGVQRGRPAESGEEPSGLSTAGMSDDVADVLANCARCHGFDGGGVGSGETAGAFPNIAGQKEAYLFETLTAFASGRRESGIMTPAAGVYSEEILADLARYYARLPPAGEDGGTGRAEIMPPVGVALGEEGAGRMPRHSIEGEAAASRGEPTGYAALVDPAAASGPPYAAAGLAELGRRIAMQGLTERKLPACESCHGATGREKNQNYPYIAGQPEWFLATQLQLFKEGERLGTPFAHLMEPIAINLTEEQIDALALYYSLQPPGR